MHVAGINIGAATAKAVILNQTGICSWVVLPTGPDVVEISDQVVRKALEKAGLSQKDLQYVVATGYGRNAVPYAHKTLTEIYCHARGAKFLIPKTNMIIDIGGQDSKAVAVGSDGGVSDFLMNDKCAAGTGRFLEVMASVLQIELDQLGAISLKSQAPCQISSVCTIFAESEVVSLRAQKAPVEDIVAGIHKAATKRVATMARRVGYPDAIVFTGGVAKNIGMVRALERELEADITIPEEPQIVGALGAALIAAEWGKGDIKTG